MVATGMAVAVGLLGLQTRTMRVAAVVSRAIASRSWVSSSSSGTSIARAPVIAARGGHIANDGQAQTISAPGSSIAVAAASGISHEPLPSVTLLVGMS